MAMMVKVGLEVLASNPRDWVPWGARVGLVMGPGSTKADYRSAREVVRELVGHGSVRVLPPAARVGMGPLWDPWPGLAGEDLQCLDLLLVDLQDVGCVWYGTLPVLFDVLSAAAAAGLKVVILDRPNPLGGLRPHGPRVALSGLDSAVSSLPVLHALSVGELALWSAARLPRSPELEVVRVKGWKRHMQWPASGRPWVIPSPHLPQFESCLCYPGTALMAGSNLSRGHGTSKPYELVGAPWVAGEALARALHGSGLRGAVFRAVGFRPCAGRWAEQTCSGVQLHVLDAEAFRPLEAGLVVLREVMRSHRAGEFRLESPPPDPETAADTVARFLDSDGIRSWLEGSLPVAALQATWQEDLSAWQEERQPYLLYLEGAPSRATVTRETLYGPGPQLPPTPHPSRWSRPRGG